MIFVCGTIIEGRPLSDRVRPGLRLVSHWSRRLPTGKKLLQLLPALLCLLLVSALTPAVCSPAQELPDPLDRLHHDQRAKMEKERRETEWKKLREDTDKLSLAAIELKELIEKSNKDTLSIQILKKTDEIEKILKDIRRRAKDGF